MATINTPGAVVSPYPAAAAAPTVLRAAADGTTVLATAAAAAATVSELAAANANTLVVVNGEAALNSLIATSRSGVFEGANVTINLEEQNFNTTNQVTSNTNYPSGNTGEIQYNSGDNSFASDPYFTYTNSNVVTPGIRTNNYLYANGAPFIGGGNAAIGNFVFTGDVMSISDANQVMSITGNGTGNVNVTANSNVWVFNNVGNLILPSNTSGINYANGSPYGSSNYSNSNVSSFLAAFGSNVVSTTGNITGGNLTTTGTANVASLAVTGSVTVQGSIGVSSSITVSSYLSANGNILTGNNVSAAGNITGNFFFGNGSQLTGVVSSYGNANVVANLAALGSNPVLTTGNVTGGNLLFGTGIVSGTGNISGNYFIGNGSQLTGISGSATLPLANGTSNINIATANGNVTVTANGNTWTFNTDGNLTLPTAGNIVGAVNIIGNGTGNVNVIANGRAWTFAADGNLVLPLAGNIVNYGNTWNFGLDGNLTLPGNIIAINYANGNRVTGNITFRDEIVIGTGTSNLISGLYLAPSSSSANSNMYLRVRGNITDEPTHIHFDTGNNAYYNQFIGDDNKYIQLANTGNIVINSNDVAGNAAQWTFAADGNLTFPTGNLVITPDLAAEANAAVISSTDHVLALVSNGVNGGVQSVWVEDIANIGTSNIAAVRVSPVSQTGNVQIQTGNNSSINTWTFSADGNLTLPSSLIVPANSIITGDGASPAPSINGFDTINAITFSASGNITGNNLDAVNLVINSITSDDSTFVTIEDGVNVHGEISATGNITGNYILGNGSQLTGISTANIGNVTFNDVNIIGDGNLRLQPDPGNAAAYLDIYLTAGPDIHIAGNGETVILGTDTFANVTVNVDGNVSIQASNGTPHTWTFAADGNLIFPTGNLVITPDDPAGNIASIVSTDHPLAILSTGANGSAATFWVEDFANFGTSNIAAVYVNPVSQTGNVQIQTGNNSSITAWNFTPDGNLTLPNGAVINDTVGNAVAFGRDAAATGPQGNAAVAIGQQAGETSQGASAVAIGYQAGLNTQGINAVAIGNSAGNSTQGANAVAIGANAASYAQGAASVAIGLTAGNNSQGANSVAIGSYAGNTQGIEAVAVGYSAGGNVQSNYAVAVGSYAAEISQGTYAVAVGYGAGGQGQGSNSVAIGTTAANDNQGINAIAIGNSAGFVLQGNSSVAIGQQAGNNQQQVGAVAIGDNAGAASQGQFAVAVGAFAGNNAQGTDAVAVGLGAGNDTQGITAVAVGREAGYITQGNAAVAIGNAAGLDNQGNYAVAVGHTAGANTQGQYAVAVGNSAGLNNQGTYAVAVGLDAGSNTQGAFSVAVGYAAGFTTQANSAIAIGGFAGATSQGVNAVAIGVQSGYVSQGLQAVAIGILAGANVQGNNSVAIGWNAGYESQGSQAVAIGLYAGNTSQGLNAVAIGNNAGSNAQGINAVAIGPNAGNNNQGGGTVAIGYHSGEIQQGTGAVAVGADAGANVQGDYTVAVGLQAGNSLQGDYAVAVGFNAGYDTQGVNSVAIGSYAGQSAQGNNSIIINATGAGLNAATANTFTVAPVRNDVANIAEVVFYNATSKEITYGNTISVAGNITGNYFIGNGSQLTSVAVPSQTILPTIQTITAVARSAGLFGGGQGGANVTVANNIPVTEYGVIITAGTTSETYKTGALGSIPGTVSLTFTTGLNSTQYTLFAYVTSNAGTYYSNAVTGTSGICLLAGTQIALSDGTHKAIEDITYTDKLLSWDFDRGCYAETTAMWIKRSETGSQYNLLTFSDGTTLRTFDQHRIFNKQAGAFTYPMTAATPVGTVTVNEHGQEITLTNKQVIEDTIEYYNVITDYHMNLFSDTVLTSCRFNNIYPITDMKFVKDNRTLRTRAEFENVEDRFFHGLRLAEQTADIETVEWYVNRLLRTEVSTHAELAV